MSCSTSIFRFLLMKSYLAVLELFGIKEPVSVKRRLRTANCRLGTRGKMQTECKMQTAD